MSAPKSATPEQSGRARPRRGFALIIVISLLALLIMVLVSLATLTRIEAGVGANSLKQAQAQQNARFALDLAIGELQRHAGPDQRVTATAEILPAPPGAGLRHWTGVWYSNESTDARTWLVSGSEGELPGVFQVSSALATFPSLTGATTALTELSISDGNSPTDAVLLVGGATCGTSPDAILDYVVAPLVDLRGAPADGPPDARTGRIAWWVGDESVKARTNLVDPYSGEISPSTANSRARATVAQRVGIERASRSAGTSVQASNQLGSDYPANSSVLERVVASSQLAFTDVPLEAVRSRFHDFTSWSHGVLSNVAAGGLKRDLNRALADVSEYPDNRKLFSTGQSSDPTWGDLRSYSTVGGFRAPGAEFSGPVTPFPSVAGRQGTFPLVTGITLRFGVIANGGMLAATFQPTVVLANPYDMDLAASNYHLEIRNGRTAGSGGALLLRPQGGSSLFPTGGGGGSRFNDIFGGTIVSAFRLNFPPNLQFAPGEVKVFGAGGVAIPIELGVVQLSHGYDTANYFVRSSGVPADGHENFQANLLGGEYDFAFRIDGGAELQLVREIGVSNYSATSEIGTVSSVGQTLFMRGAVGAASTDSTNVASGRVRWLANHSIRAPIVERFDKSVDATWGYWLQNVIWDNKTLNSQITDALWGPHFASPNGSSNVVLFHVPRSEPLSLGQFQHAGFPTTTPVGLARPTYAIGNSYASPYVPVNAVTNGARSDISYLLNQALWDEFFVSGSIGPTMPSDGLRNTRLVARAHTAPLTTESVAASLWVSGPFNVNSTSVDAWASVLSSLNGIRDPSGATSAGIPNPILRTAYPASGTANPSGGMVSLTDTQVRRLAGHVVDQVISRGPFRSLADFVNRRLPSEDSGATRENLHHRMGALQAALDSSSASMVHGELFPAHGIQPTTTQGWRENATTTSLPPDLAFPEAGLGALGANLTGWVSQADILTALGPILTVRSDTFLIRTYGESVNPVTGETEARAWCEAVVQRMPEYVDPDNAPWDRGGELTETNDQFGRRFQIVYFRWLTPADI